MPNWCEGSLKVRGTKENLTKFILEGLHPADSKKLTVDEYGRVNSAASCWIEGTRRGFVKRGLELYMDELDYYEQPIIVLDTRFA